MLPIQIVFGDVFGNPKLKCIEALRIFLLITAILGEMVHAESPWVPKVDQNANRLVYFTHVKCFGLMVLDS